MHSHISMRMGAGTHVRTLEIEKVTIGALVVGRQPGEAV